MEAQRAVVAGHFQVQDRFARLAVGQQQAFQAQRSGLGGIHVDAGTAALARHKGLRQRRQGQRLVRRKMAVMLISILRLLSRPLNRRHFRA